MFRQLTARLLPRSLQAVSSQIAQTANKIFAQVSPEEERESTLLLTIGWVSAGLGAVALGLFVGRELRSLYKFNRRTPYDFYAHSGDELQDMEFGVGI